METIASVTRSALSTATAASLTRARETLSRRTLDEMSIAIRRAPFTRSPPRLGSGARILCVCLDYLPHQSVPNDVSIGEIMEPDAFDARQNALDLHQS